MFTYYSKAEVSSSGQKKEAVAAAAEDEENIKHKEQSDEKHENKMQIVEANEYYIRSFELI